MITYYSTVFYVQRASTADAPQGQQEAHDLERMHADFTRPQGSQAVILLPSLLLNMQVHLLLTQGHCTEDEAHVHKHISLPANKS